VGIKIKLGKKYLKISLNLMTVQIKDEILPKVWIRDRNRRGIQSPPIHIDLKTSVRQYEGSNIPYLEGRLDLKLIIKGLLKDGLLEPNMSPFNTPILPLKKPGGSYQMVHSKQLVIPNPYTLLSNIPPDYQWFSVVD
jgi:hypothetical protein